MTAASPAPRRRPGARATNVDTGPLVPDYETKARQTVRANIAKNTAASLEKLAHAETNKAMLAANVNTFEFQEGNKTYVAKIASDTEDKVSTAKLYAKVTAGEITLDQFVSMVTATQAAVKTLFGTNMLNAVLDTKTKDAALTIKEKKA